VARSLGDDGNREWDDERWQAGCIAAPQAIVNAIVDALAPLGIDHFDMPATPERVWRAIRSAGG
jgi:hypothetical protein